MLDFRVETFLSACRTLNYTETARELNITQPAVSQHIHHLERVYAAKLFEYRDRKLKLTRQGAILKDACASMSADEGVLQRKMAALEGETERLTIGVTKTVGEYAIADKLADFIETHPMMQVTIRSDDTDALLKSMDEGRIDCALIEGYFDHCNYAWRLYRSEPFIGVYAPDMPSAPELATTREFDDLLGQRLITREQGSGTRAVLERALAEHNLSFKDFDRVTEVNNIGLIKYFVQRGVGIAFLYEMAVSTELASGALKRLELTKTDLSHDITFVWRKNTCFDRFYTDIFESLTEHVPKSHRVLQTSTMSDRLSITRLRNVLDSMAPCHRIEEALH